MEKINLEKTKKENSQDFFTPELSGKARADLSPEQAKAERAYCEKELEDLLKLINDDEVLCHSTNNLDAVLQAGILSTTGMHQRGKGPEYGYGPQFQDVADRLLKKRIPEFLDNYAKYKSGELSEAEFFLKREELINKFPKIGKLRARRYFEEVLPRGQDRGWFEDGYSELKDDELAGKKISQIKKRLQANEVKNVAGFNTISSTDTHIIKKGFSDYGYLSAGSGGGDGGGGVSIFFKRPREDKLMDLDAIRLRPPTDDGGTPEFVSGDIGVHAKVSSNSFRAVVLDDAVYDKEDRTLFLLGSNIDFFSESHEIFSTTKAITKLQSLQKEKGLLVFSGDFQPVPPLESIEIVKLPYGENVFYEIEEIRRGEPAQPQDSYSQERSAKLRAPIEQYADSNLSPDRLLKIRKRQKIEIGKKVNKIIADNNWDWSLG